MNVDSALGRKVTVGSCPFVAALAILGLFVFSTSTSKAADTLWTSLRGTCEGTAACRWMDALSAAEIREWHFTSKSSRRYKMGLAVWASPAVAVVNGRPMAFIGGYDQTMHGLDLLSKDRIWFKITNGEIGSPPAIGLAGGRQTVFWSSADRTVYAHVAATGDRVWSRELIAPTNTMGDAQVSAPLLHDGVLYITAFAYDKALARSKQSAWLFALDMEVGGKILWRREVSNGPVSSPAGRMMGNEFHLFVAARKGLIQAFRVSRNGFDDLWNYQMPHEVMGSPVIERDTDAPLLFVGSKYGNIVAIDGRTGTEVWSRMAGNWIDNTACIARVDGVSVVFVGSHDYNVYAFRAADGERLWRRHLGGEVYSAPAFLDWNGTPAVIVASLDNHLYAINARTGTVETSYYTGQPIWDKVSKGENLWGSPAVLQAGDSSAAIHGSFNGTVYVLPLGGECSLRAKVQSAKTLWWGLLTVMVLFLGVIVPVVLGLSGRREDR